MVKLVTARAHRLYGPQGSEKLSEVINSVIYLAGTVLLLAGLILLLADFSHPLKYDNAHAGLILLSVGICILILVNLHDLGAHVAGVDSVLHLVAYDPQLVIVEVGAPLVYIIGAVLYLVAVILLLKSNNLVVGGKDQAALTLLIVGSVCWVLGSLHNACQVYNRCSPSLQILQKAVYLPLLVASVMLLISSVLWFKSWPHFVVARTSQFGAIVIALIAAVLVVVGALMNIIRVFYVSRLPESQSSPPAVTIQNQEVLHDEIQVLDGDMSLQPLLEQEATPGEELVPNTHVFTIRPEPTINTEEDTFAIIR